MDISEILSGLVTIGFFLFVVVASVSVYFVPVAIAWYRKLPNFVPILIVNTFLGCTCLGWLGALVMASWANREPQEPTAVNIFQSGPGQHANTPPVVTAHRPNDSGTRPPWNSGP